MNRAIGVALACGLGLSVLGAAAVERAKQAQAEGEKPKKAPFYRPYLVLGNPLDDRIREQEKLIEANPKSASLHNDLGNLLALRRFPKEARQEYALAMKLDRHSYLAPYNMGIVFETEGKISQAIRAYEKAVDWNRGFPPGLFRLGRLYEKRGWDKQAVEAYAKALRIDPAMRDPRHNPLVVDTRLLDRASLANYQRDLATASLSSDARYGDETRFRRLPYDRVIYSEEAEEPPPAAAGTPTPPAGALRVPSPIPAAPGQTRPQAIAPAPTSAMPPTPPRPTPTPSVSIFGPPPPPPPTPEPE